MKNYQGVVIEESLDDKSFLTDLTITSTETEKVTEKHQTPWISQWTMDTVEISPEKIDEVADKISKVLDLKHSANWYADFKNDTFHYVIFLNKVFKLDRTKKSDYEAMQKYGSSIGVPDYQLPSFTGFDEQELERQKSRRSKNTLFMLCSVDGKINSGSSDTLDVDADWQKINGLKEGLHQYYEIEQTTDLFSFNTGRVLAKIGINEKVDTPTKSPVSFVIVDNEQHLKESGINYLTNWLKKLIIVTTNKNYDTFGNDSVDVIYYDNEIDFQNVSEKLKQEYGAESVTIQSGGTMNGVLLRAKLIDFVNIVIAPVLAGGKDTPTVIDGKSLTDISELDQLGILKLLECKQLNDSYINLKYKVIK